MHQHLRTQVLSSATVERVTAFVVLTNSGPCARLIDDVGKAGWLGFVQQLLL